MKGGEERRKGKECCEEEKRRETGRGGMRRGDQSRKWGVCGTVVVVLGLTPVKHHTINKYQSTVGRIGR